jgi:integrase
MSIYSIIQIPITEGGKGSSIPLMLLESGQPSRLTLSWTRHRALNEGYRNAALTKAAHAIGRFYDFYTLEKKCKPLNDGELRILLAQFFEARRFGLPSLGWQPVRRKTAKADAVWVEDFVTWCRENLQHASPDKSETLFLDNLNLEQQFSPRPGNANRKKWDLLIHLHPSSATGNGGANTSGGYAGKNTTSAKEAKHFPPNHVWALIKSTRSIRDKLFLLLLFFGGIRISEALHIYATDVTVAADGVARVVLGHPHDGHYEWIDYNGKIFKSTRGEFLKSRYDVGPRNFLAVNHPLHAGWKGMMMDDGTRAEAVVHWLRDDAGILFGKLHKRYMRETRTRMLDRHPYYFINEREGFFGTPLKLSNAEKLFNRAAARVGLPNTLPGVNPHGARHFYGFYCASVLRLSLEVTQRLMHHVCIESTETYYALSLETVRGELLAAQKRQLLSKVDPLGQPGSWITMEEE